MEQNLDQILDFKTTTLNDSNITIKQGDLLSYEVEIKKSACGRLILTNYRIIWRQKSIFNMVEEVSMPIDEISFIGFKRITNPILIILSILLILCFSVMLLMPSHDKTQNYVGIGLGLFFLIIAQIKVIVISSSGGDLNIFSGVLNNLREWIDAIFFAKHEFVNQKSRNPKNF
jgi:hypothetical protein